MKAAPDFSTNPRTRSPVLSGRTLFFLAAGLVLIATADAFRAARGRDLAQEELRRGGREVEVRRARLRDLDLAARRGSTLHRQAELTARASPPWVIADLARALPPDARLDSLALEYRDELELELGVETRSPAAYDRLLEALAASGRVFDLVPGPEVREGPVASSLKGIYRPREEP
jgi:hypothetical protein